MLERSGVQAPWISVPKDNRELKKWYDRWAKEYERDMGEVYGCTLCQLAGDLVAQHIPDRASLILDAGAGTGLMGRILAEYGFHNVVGIDLSSGMLEEARAKNVCRDLHFMTLGEPLDFPSDHFDAVVSIGVLTTGHAPPSSLDELMRVTRPGGAIVFSMRQDTYEGVGFKEKQEALATAGRCQLVEVSPAFQGLPKGEPDTQHCIYLYQVHGK